MQSAAKAGKTIIYFLLSFFLSSSTFMADPFVLSLV